MEEPDTYSMTKKFYHMAEYDGRKIKRRKPVLDI